MAKSRNEFTVTFRLEDDGSLKAVGQEAERTGKKLKKGVTDQAHSADRAMKGLSNQSSNATKNFSKMSQGLAGGIVPIYATLAAQIFAVSAAFQFLKGAADYRMLLEGQRAYGVATGVMYKGLTRIIMDATDSQITYTEAAQAVAIGTASGLSPGQLEELATAAKRVSIALGRDMTDSFNRLVRGATKAEPELLDELGIVLRLEPALKKYADQIGKSAKELTAFQRTQAVTNEILEQAEAKYAAIEAIMDPQTNKLNEAAVAFDELMNAIKLMLAGPVEKLASFFSKNILSAVSLLVLFAYSIIKNMLPSIKDWQVGIAEAAGNHKDRIDAMKLDLASYRAELAATQAQARGGFAGGLATQQGRARGLDPATYGATSGMALLATGQTPSKRQLGSLKAQLTKKTGPFSDKALGGDPKAAEKIREQWRTTFDSMDKNAKKTGKSIKSTYKEIKLSSKISATGAAMQWEKVKGVFVGIASWGLKILRFFSLLGLATVIGAPIYEAVRGFFNAGDAAEMAGEGVENFITQQRILNAEAKEFLEYSQQISNTGYWQDIAQSATMVSNIRPLEQLEELEKASETERTANQAARRQVGPQAPFFITRLLNNIIGRSVGGVVASDLEAAVDAQDVVDELKMNLIETLDVLDQRQPHIQQWGEFRDIIQKTGRLTKEQRNEYERLVLVMRKGQAAVKNESELLNKLSAAGNAWTNPKATPRGNLMDETAPMIQNLKDQIAMGSEGRDPRSLPPEVKAMKLRVEVMEAFLKQLKKIDTDLESARAGKASAVLTQEVIKGSVLSGTQYAARASKEQDLEKNRNDLLAQQALLRENMLKNMEKMTLAQQTAHLVERATLKDTIELLEQKNITLKNATDSLHQIGVAATTALETGMQNAIVGVMEGTKSMKEGFLDMAKAVLQAIAQIIAKLIAMKAIESAAMAFGFPIPFARGGIIPMAKGGIMNRKVPGYSRGTPIVTEPTYIVGEGKYNEAVVPLPDGRSIPVTMKGAGGNIANVTVNVMSDGQTTSSLTANGGDQAAQMGRAISAAVQEEMHKQQLPGGMLSPYSVGPHGY